MHWRVDSAEGSCLFEREHHRRVATVLEGLDAELLLSHACLFGGGTAIALRYGEYRESVDIDFLVSELEGYRALRQRLASAEGIRAIARPGAAFEQAREMRADQYGVRTRLRVLDLEIKFEIVLEARIALQPPAASDRIRGVATLTPLDMATSKLLANSDRWSDDATLGRDVIDLAMMQPSKSLLKQAIDKARAAYGNSIEADLAKAIADLRDRPRRLEHCMGALAMNVPRAVVWKRLRALVPRGPAG